MLVKVREYRVTNFIARYLYRRGWSGFTLPTPLGPVVLYWLPSKLSPVIPSVRKHELIHVEQIARYGWFGFTWRYVWELVRNGYKLNRFEIEAYEREQD